MIKKDDNLNTRYPSVRTSLYTKNAVKRGGSKAGPGLERRLLEKERRVGGDSGKNSAGWERTELQDMRLAVCS